MDERRERLSCVSRPSACFDPKHQHGDWHAGVWAVSVGCVSFWL